MLTKKLIKLMNERKINEIDISVRSGLNKATVSRWMNCPSNPNLTEYIMLCRCFNVPIDFFYNENSVSETSNSSELVVFGDSGRLRFFHKRLEMVINNSGLSFSYMAKSMGVTKKSISRWVNEGAFPRSSDYMKLCELMKVPYGFFIHDCISLNMRGNEFTHLT
jgi:transcriptional regulator with XRE-family HTH domain